MLFCWKNKQCPIVVGQEQYLPWKVGHRTKMVVSEAKLFLRSSTFYDISIKMCCWLRLEDVREDYVYIERPFLSPLCLRVCAKLLFLSPAFFNSSFFYR